MGALDSEADEEDTGRWSVARSIITAGGGGGDGRRWCESSAAGGGAAFNEPSAGGSGEEEEEEEEGDDDELTSDVVALPVVPDGVASRVVPDDGDAPPVVGVGGDGTRSSSPLCVLRAVATSLTAPSLDTATPWPCLPRDLPPGPLETGAACDAVNSNPASASTSGISTPRAVADGCNGGTSC